MTNDKRNEIILSLVENVECWDRKSLIETAKKQLDELGISNKNMKNLNRSHLLYLSKCYEYDKYRNFTDFHLVKAVNSMNILGYEDLVDEKVNFSSVEFLKEIQMELSL